MNCATRFMYPLFETIRVQDGKPCHLSWHEFRFRRSYEAHYGYPPNWSLTADLQVPAAFAKNKVKLKLRYNAWQRDCQFAHYADTPVRSLQLIEADDDLDYALKYSDRSALQELYRQRKSCDDVLIVHRGQITDTSYANIVFWDGQQWVTPKSYLLRGTARERLLAQGDIREVVMGPDAISNFEAWQIINAMRDLVEAPIRPVGAILK